MFFLNKTTPATSAKLHKVNLDAYGNAIPDVPSTRAKGSHVAASIVETREVVIQPSIKRQTRQMKSLPAKEISLTQRLLPWMDSKKSMHLAMKNEAISADIQYIPKQSTHLPSVDAPQILSEIVERSFQKLQGEFDSREQQLEKRFQSLKQQNQLEITKKRRWLVPLVATSAVAVGYMLYVLTNMQHSMTTMSASIPTMNQHMGSMAMDTQAMSGNMQSMGQSLDDLNGNVSQMNQQMGGISKSVEPMGEAAETVQPFFGMMRSFMPF